MFTVQAVACWVSRDDPDMGEWDGRMSMDELLGVRQGRDMGGGCHHRETALPDQELSEPSQLRAITSSNILPTSSTTFEEA